jgi:hypothetical protein
MFGTSCAKYLRQFVWHHHENFTFIYQTNIAEHESVVVTMKFPLALSISLC